MTLGEIIALLKDAAIVAAIIWVYHAGANGVKVADLKAMQTQIQANAKQEAAWAKERTDHDAQLQTDLSAARSAIAQRSAPIIVRVPAGSGVSKTPAQAASGNPPSGGAESGAGRDIRPLVNAFESKVEGVIADCHKLEDPHQ